MKAFLKRLMILSSIVLVSCSGGGGTEDPGPPEPQNNAPTVPSLLYPTDNLLCISNALEFEWNAANDNNGDAISYEVQVSKDNQFSDIKYTTITASTKHTFTLEKGFAYYWRVKAKDSRNAESDFSSVFNLYTEGEGIINHLPFAPDLVKPDLNSTIEGSETSLEWLGSDTDNDSLKYDVYFDTVDPPITKVSEDQSETIRAQSITAGTSYYWKVVVKDNKGAETIGQIWKFKTK